MKVLLDTNIIINRESFPTDPNIGFLFKWLDKLQYEKTIHPISIEEIEKNSNLKLVHQMKIKLGNYNVLRTLAPICDEIRNFVDNVDKTENAKNDSKILNELLCERVDCLITEDKEIYTKADSLNLSHKVFTINSFIEKVVTENPDFIDYKVPIVKKEYFGNINVNDPFFDSFKEDYGQEDYLRWFNKKANEIAYISKSGDRIIGLLYLKTEDGSENYSDIEPVFSRKKRLKIGTFKVATPGIYIGERFLKIVFDHAVRFKADEIYVTIFNNNATKQDLVNLLKDFGFNCWGTKTSNHGKEEVYVRDFSKIVDKSSPRKTFPYFSVDSDAFIVPIYPEYHTNLLPDSILRTESSLDFVENEPFRNAIVKVYVSRSIEKNLKAGDLIIFYRTGGYYLSVITTIGIVDSVITDIKDEEQFKILCGKRSVFNSDEELHHEWIRDKNRPFIVNFLYAYSLPKRINLKRLIELGIVSGIDNAPRGFVKINKEDFLKIIKEVEVDEGIIVY